MSPSRLVSCSLALSTALACMGLSGCGGGAKSNPVTSEHDPASTAYQEKIAKKVQENPPPPGVKGTVNSGGEFVPDDNRHEQ